MNSTHNYLRFFLPLFFIACNGSNSSLPDTTEAELKNHFVNQYKMIDPSSRVDSFAVLEIDTITQQSRYASLAFDFMGEWQKQNQLMELENSLLQKRIGLMQLTKDQPEAEANKEEARQSLDTISAIESRIEEAQKKMNYYDSLSKTADALKPIGYEAICIYRIQKKDWTDQIDTAFIVMDRNKKIVTREEFYRQ